MVKKTRKESKKSLSILTSAIMIAIAAVLCVATVIGHMYSRQYADLISVYFNQPQTKIVSTGDKNTQHFASSYKSDAEREKALKEFGRIKDFTDICDENIRAYDEFAKKRCKCQSSVYNYHKILKVFVREAYAAHLISENPYQNFKLDRGKRVARKFLTKEELTKLETKQIDDMCLNRVRDLFLFCCYTGLAYADLAIFNFKDAIMTDGMYRIRDERIKTGTPYNISLMDKVMNILKKYEFKLPVISNQKYNSYLKILGAFCEIKKKLTSHVARHTFATTIALANGVRIEVISKMLGHTNIQTTQLYAHIYQAEVDKEFERLNNIV